MFSFLLKLIHNNKSIRYKIYYIFFVNFRQILTTCFPIHSVLPALLEVYTQSILLPTSSTIGGAKVELTNEPLSDDEVLSAFQSFQNKRLAPQLLILYYVLLYEDNRLNNCRNLVHSCRSIKSYSGKLFSQIPIKFLLQEAQKNQNQCGGTHAYHYL